MINKFERNLRCFLYLKSIPCSDNKALDFIKDLETLDFGKIYEFLFVDTNFCNKARTAVKNNYAKVDLIAQINGFEESTYWDKIFGTNTLGYIKNNFWKIRGYRNDVMHAHNINYHAFSEAKKMFQTANACLDTEIQELIRFPESPKDSELFVESAMDRLQELISNASEFNIQFQSSGILEKFFEGIDMMQRLSTLTIKPEVKESVDNLLKLLGQTI